MSFADTSSVQLAYIAETEWGTTPTTPTFAMARVTSETLDGQINTVVSQELAADRNVRDVVPVSGSAGGGFAFELSYGTFDALMEAVLSGTWSVGDELVNGVAEKSFTIEKKLMAGEYIRYTGMRPNTMNLSMTAEQLITGNFDFVGKGSARATALISGATYGDPTTADVMSASDDFASLSITGVSGDAPSIRSLTLDITNNLRPIVVAGSREAAGVGKGRFEVTGSIEAYFSSGVLYNAFVNNTALALSFNLGSTSTKIYTISLPKVKLESASITAGGLDQDLMTSLTWRGLYDDTLEGTMKITRGVTL